MATSRSSSRRSTQSEVVVKSNDFVRAKTDWTTVEHRVALKLIAQLRKDDKEFGVQTVRIREIIELSGSKSNDLYSRAEEICEKLLDQKIRVQEETPEGDRIYKGYNLMSSCEYVEGSGKIRAKFNPDMQPFLLALKRRFTMYKLQFVMRLSTPYAIRLYEIIKMREDLRTIRMKISELREILSVEDKYERFTDLKKYVLEPARAEIRKKCDVYFNYRVEREGRTPKYLQLMIHPNEDVDAPMIQSLSMPVAPNGSAEEGAYSDAADGRNRGKESKSSERPQHGVSEGSDARPPAIDARKLFLHELSQAELAELSEEDIDELHEQAQQQVKTSNPGRGPSVVASEIFRTMCTLWKERYTDAEA